MTVRLLVQYGKYPANSLFSGGAAVEEGLRITGQADTNLSLGVAFVDPVETQRSGPPSIESTGGVDLLKADGRTVLDLTAAQASVSGAWNSKTSPAVYMDCLCNETSGGIFRDRSGNGRHLIPAAGATNAFANPGYFTSTAGANGHAFSPSGVFSLDLFTDSFYFSAVINIAAPGANQNIAGFANTSTANGLYLSARTGTNIIAPVVQAAGGTWLGVTGYPNTVIPATCDGTDHHIALAYDAPTRSIYYWVDGKIAIVAPGVVLANAASPTNTGFALGCNLDAGASSPTSVAAKFKNPRFLKLPNSGLPLNISEIAFRSYSKPELQLYASDVFPQASKRIAAADIGQSNEAGASDYPDFTIGGVGAPQIDSITASGLTSITPPTASSWHPRVQRIMGERGVWHTTLNTARGTTSIAQMWVGQILNWAASTSFGVGAYVVAAGKLYKLTSSSGTTSGTVNIAATAASAPTWPASGTVTDGDATWTYLRAATGADVLGVLDSSSPLFDPNGYLATINTNLGGFPASGGDKIVRISIGQTDKSLGTTQAQYQAAIQAATNWALAKGWKVFIGLTCSGTTAGYHTWLTTVGQPGKNAALASYAGNPNVFAGADLLDALGALTVTTTSIGLKADQLHLNVFGREAAGTFVANAYVAAGY